MRYILGACTHVCTTWMMALKNPVPAVTVLTFPQLLSQYYELTACLRVNTYAGLAGVCQERTICQLGSCGGAHNLGNNLHIKCEVQEGGSVCVCDVCKCRATLNAVEPLNGIIARIHLANQSGNCVRLCDGKDPLTPGENILCAKPFNYTFLHHHHTCACRRGQFFSISAGHARAICERRTRTGEPGELLRTQSRIQTDFFGWRNCARTPLELPTVGWGKLRVKRCARSWSIHSTHKKL